MTVLSSCWIEGIPANDDVELAGKWRIQGGSIVKRDSTESIVETIDYLNPAPETDFYLFFENSRVFVKIPGEKADVFFYKYKKKDNEILLTRVQNDRRQFARIFRVSNMDGRMRRMRIFVSWPVWNDDKTVKKDITVTCWKTYPGEIEFQN